MEFYILMDCAFGLFWAHLISCYFFTPPLDPHYPNTFDEAHFFVLAAKFRFKCESR